jgi:hypothetical protein
LAALTVAFLGLLTPSALRADNLVVNGDFSSEGANWTLTNAATGSDFYFGTRYAEFAGTSAGYYDTISQTIGTQSGYEYTISFELQNNELTSDADFQVLWNGIEVFDESGLSADDYGSYTLYTVTVDGTGSDTLSFAGYQVPSEYYLTDVTVSTDGPVSGVTPEPSCFYLLGSGLVALGGLMRRKLRA